MKASLGSLAQVQPQRLWSAAVAGCLLVPMLFLTLLRQGSPPLSIMNVQVSIVEGDDGLPAGGGGADAAPGRDRDKLLVENNDAVSSGHVGGEKPTPQAAAEGAGGGGIQQAVDGSTSHLPTGEDQPTSTPPPGEERRSPPAPSTSRGGDSGSQKPETETETPTTSTTAAEQGRITCDFTHVRTDVCELHGDVRINGSSSSVVVLAASPAAGINASWTIKPYARKWETNTMASVTEFSVAAAGAGGAPVCTVNHAVPAVVFSTGGLQGNFFHDMADVLVPLFLTTRHYGGEVQLLVTQYRPSWVEKYRAMLRRLSRYDAVDLDGDPRVHCFPAATVGLRSHRELGIDPAMEPRGSSMADFRAFLRSCYGLRREFPTGRDPARRPRLLFLSRRGSRSLLNERRVFRAARGVGFKVVVAPPQSARNMSQFARTVNSCDVMAGVHGAGLTNMVFLPANATLLQIVPYGELKYPCRFPYGDPAVGMGLRYLEYEVGKEESSLVRRYPRDHPVLADPLSIHRQGFPAVWSIYIDKQNVTVDVARFRPTLLEAIAPFR